MKTPEEVLAADIPQGDYALAMEEIQSAIDFSLDFDDRVPDQEEIAERLKSYCTAFELMEYATKMGMKVKLD